MKRQWLKIVLFLLIIAAAVAARFLIENEQLDIHTLKQHKEQLLSFIDAHYLLSVLSFILLYLATALLLPGALILTIGGGMAFGVLPTVAYANAGATTGAVLAFITARFLIGDWVQERFQQQLKEFNSEIARHGKNYLLVLRILPIAPFFVINYCAGLTKVPLTTFIWTTCVGMIPGSLVYAFIGHQLRNVEAAGDLFSWKIMLGLLLLALFAMLPVLKHYLSRLKKIP